VIKRKRNKKKRILFRAGPFKSKKRKSSSLGPGLIRLLKISSIAFVVIAIGTFFIFAEKYVRTTKPTGTGPVVFVNTPEWIGPQLKSKILEKMNKPARKLRITGNGRCNLTNMSALEDFIGHFGPNGRFLRQVFSQFFNI